MTSIFAMLLFSLPVSPGHAGDLAKKLGVPHVQSFLLLDRESQRKHVPVLAKVVRGRRDFDQYWQALGVLERMGPDAAGAAGALAFVLRESPGEKRVVELLGRIGPGARAAEPALASILKRGKPQMRRAALRALARIGPTSISVPALRRALAGEDCVLAVRALAKAGPAAAPAAGELAARLLAAAGDAECGYYAGLALRRLGPAAAPMTSRLIAGLWSPRMSIRLAAATALSALAPRVRVDGAALLGYESGSYSNACRAGGRKFAIHYKYLRRFAGAEDPLAVAKEISVWVLHAGAAVPVDLGLQVDAFKPWPVREADSLCAGQGAFYFGRDLVFVPLLTGLGESLGYRLSGFVYEPGAHTVRAAAYDIAEIDEAPPIALLEDGLAFRDSPRPLESTACGARCGRIRGMKVERIEDRVLPLWWSLRYADGEIVKRVDVERSWTHGPVRRFFESVKEFADAFRYDAAAGRLGTRWYRLAKSAAGKECIFPTPDRANPYDPKLWNCR